MTKSGSMWLGLAFAVALTGMLGSLFWSNVLHLSPCDLCWAERICMYPLVVILGIHLWRMEKKPLAYVVPLTGVGMLLSLYNYGIQISKTLAATASCNPVNPCTNPQITWVGGWVTPPLLAFCGFVMILMFTWMYQRKAS